jgi:hypothetical protein
MDGWFSRLRTRRQFKSVHMDGRSRGALRARTLGLVGGKRRRRVFLGAVAPIAVLGAVLISNALAIQDVGVFELDRNAEDSNGAATSPDDWDTLFEDTVGAAGHSLLFTGILPDVESASDPGDQFTGGGSKDDLDIPSWRWKEGEPLDKDDITNAYSAGYTIPADAPNTSENGNRVGDFVVYFGLDRFDTSGSAQVGFWFLKDNVAQTNVKKNGAFTFSGTHQNGDILVQSNFSNGGNVDSVTVFQWLNGSLQQVGSAGDCNPSSGTLSNALACATVNRQSEASPWDYIPKGASADSDFPTSAFYEGGINLSRLARSGGASTGCLSTFLAETRSSTPFNAALKDLDLGEFDTCDATMTTQSSTNATNLQPGANVTDSAVITGTSLVGGSPPRPTGSVKFYLCKPAELTSGQCSSGGTLVSTDTTLVTNPPDPPTSDSLAESSGPTSSITTEIGKYCWRAEYIPDTASAPFYSATSHTNGTTECFEVAAVPTATTTNQFVYPQDKAKITVPSGAGGTLAGNVTFRLFANFADCSANTNPVHTEGPITVSGTGSPSTATATTTNYPGGSQIPQGGSAYAITSDTSVWWRVSFVSTNGSQLNSVSDCHLDSNQAQVGEKTTVSFLGNDSSITVP